VANGVKVEILAKLILQVSFQTAGGIKTANLEFNVMEGLSLDLIIGLPSICNHFQDVLAEMMGKVLLGNTCEEEQHLDMVDQPLINENILSTVPSDPWNQEYSNTISEEELMIPEPGSSTPTPFNGVALETAREEFLQQLGSRISSGFATAT
ncbi:MAG: hypothetical protein ACK53L_32080, partial [Pirellulaceae bacterium]